MSLTSDESSPKTSELRSEGWLESWKEIAAYLRRSVRSARRWEKEEGLPIHRHPHAKGDSVYAYKAELDGWWKNRGLEVSDSENGETDAATPIVQDEQAIAAPPVSVQEPGLSENIDLPKKPRTAFLLGVGISVAILVAVAWVSRRETSTSPKRPALPFEAREWVLVSAFENRSGQPQLNGTMEYALERELSNSRYVNVVPRERIGDTLRLMRKPLDTRVDPAVGREICLRDGDIRALITGRIERLGKRYLLTAELVDPLHGTAVASVAEEASDDERLLPAARRISDRVRTMLGENVPLTQAGEGSLLKATTPSLSALRLYSQADALIATGGDAAAEDLLRQAVAEDPEFASAHILLAYAMSNQDKPKDTILPEVETALRLSDRTTERERYFIRASYYSFLGQREKSAAVYEALLSIYPDHFWATNNLCGFYDSVGRENDAARMAVRLADLRPKDFAANDQAAWCLARLDTNPDPTGMMLYARRAQALVTPEIMKSSPFEVAWLELLSARERWLTGDVTGALSLAKGLDRKLASEPLLRTNEAFSHLGNFYVALGRLRAAENVFHHETDPIRDLASLALIRGNREELKRLSNAIVPRDYYDRLETATLLARGGLIHQADRVLAERDRRVDEDSQGMLEATFGELAMAKGNTAEAISQLVRCQAKHPNVGQHYFHRGMETLASARILHGDLSGAIAALQLVSNHQRKAESVMNGPHWERNQLFLAQLYRKAGRVADAQRIESELTKLVAVADPDYPILVGLRRLQGTPTQANAALVHPIH